MELDKRKHRILEAIVSHYIETGEPVGSKYLAQMTDWGLSSATIRNEMAVLTELGYIEQPHTSAGRAPSAQGYRFYIEHLMPRHTLTTRERKALDALLHESVLDFDRLLEYASEALAELTQCASVAVLSYERDATILKIELVALQKRALVVLAVSSTGAVKNKQCVADVDITPDVIDFLNRFFGDELMGHLIRDITPAFVHELVRKLPTEHRLLSPIITFVCAVCADVDEGEVHWGGQSNLLAYKELAQHAFALISLLNDSHQLIDMLAPPEDGIGVTIGDEQGREPLTQMSRIVSDIPLGARGHGMIAILGPTRIPYSKVISSLDYYTRALHRMLQEDADGE